MSSIRPVGGNSPNPIRINGQEVTNEVTPVEGRRLPTGTTTKKPVEGASDPYQLQENAYDRAHQSSVRGQNAAATIAGKKKAQARNVSTKKSEHRRIEGAFSEKDGRDQRQERAYEAAAEFEEHIKEGDLSFRRRAAQVESLDQRYEASETAGGVTISGESPTEFKFEDTVPDIALPEATQTSLRNALGLGPKR